MFSRSRDFPSHLWVVLHVGLNPLLPDLLVERGGGVAEVVHEGRTVHQYNLRDGSKESKETRTDFVQRPAALTRYLNRKDQKRLRVL